MTLEPPSVGPESVTFRGLPADLPLLASHGARAGEHLIVAALYLENYLLGGTPATTALVLGFFADVCPRCPILRAFAGADHGVAGARDRVASGAGFRVPRTLVGRPFRF